MTVQGDRSDSDPDTPSETGTETGSDAVDRDDTERILVVGEALIDVVRERSGAVREHVGGSPANVALGLGRLGRRTSLLTQVGPDKHGAMITTHLEGSGVEVLPASSSGQRTSTAIATLAEDGSAQYTFDLDWSLAASEIPFRPLAVHTGSIGALLPPGAATVHAILESQRDVATISYDPNVRPVLLGSADSVRVEIEARVALGDVVKASDEDLAWLYPGVPAADVAATWLDLGPSLVVVTLGANGSYGLAAAGVIELEPVAVTVVDTVGAGDSFMGGLLDALWSHRLLGAERRADLAAIDTETLRQCMQRAALVSAITVSRAGAQPPTSEDLAKWPVEKLPSSWGPARSPA